MENEVVKFILVRKIIHTHLRTGFSKTLKRTENFGRNATALPLAIS